MAKNDTGTKNTPDAIPLHKRLAMGQGAETGAGKGATGGKSSPKTPA
jgi:hypothetical protein